MVGRLAEVELLAQGCHHPLGVTSRILHLNLLEALEAEEPSIALGEFKKLSLLAPLWDGKLHSLKEGGVGLEGDNHLSIKSDPQSLLNREHGVAQ